MSDASDLRALAQTYLPLQRCPGGRLTHQQYICLHCEHDYSADRGCKSPTPEARTWMARGKDKIWREWEP